MSIFGLPEAKRIKRSEFLATGNDSSSRSSRHSSPSQGSLSEDQDQNQAKVDYGFEYDFVAPSQSQSQPQIPRQRPGASHEKCGEEDEDQEESEEASYQFRLFTKHSTATTTTSSSNKIPSSSSHTATTNTTTTTNNTEQALTTIRLSATPEPGLGTLASEPEISLEKTHFTRPHRPESQHYYFTSSLPLAKQSLLRSQYAAVALSSHDVLSRATASKWTGTALPWRVINLTANTPHPRPSKKGPATTSHSKTQPQGSGKQPRRRPSKKHRIMVRRQLAAKSAAKEQLKLSEEAEREKRTRRNREKRVKRKEREKRKKMDAEAGVEAVRADDADDGGSAGSE